MVYRSHLRTSRSLNDSSSAAKETTAGLDTQGSLTFCHWSWDLGTNSLWVKAHGNREVWKQRKICCQAAAAPRKAVASAGNHKGARGLSIREAKLCKYSPTLVAFMGKKLCYKSQDTFFLILKANFIMTPNVN